MADAVLDKAVKKQVIANACKTILKCLGEDPERDGLVKTPERFAESMLSLTSGYEQNLVGIRSTWKSNVLIF